MSVSRFIIGIVFSCCFIITSAQNLVPNPSFEILRNLPVKPNPKNSFEYEPLSGFIPYKMNLKYWFAATETTPDLRIGSSQFDDCRRRYKNCDKAHKGDVCVGIITYMSNRTTKTYREYVQIKLKKPLRPGELTHVEFWVAKERQAKLVSNNLGAHFSMKLIEKETLEVLPLEPQINCDTIVNTEKKKWMKMSQTFIPDKPYKFLLIGNFYDNKNTTVQTFPNYNGSPYTPPYAYYLIDDVNVWQDEAEETPGPVVFDDKQIATNEAIALRNIEFEFDKATLLTSSRMELEKLVQFMHQYAHVNIKLQGHTDEMGTIQYNQELSEARAKSVYNYLIEKGIPPARLSYVGFGESRPLVIASTKQARSRNRRVEFVVVEQKPLVK